ncbi:MAG: hypothetical protein EPN65_05820 [Pandoraea sp.]|uniref:hypothetical protein n=1 Tax=Pandoraea sp. TaxID=1883445 RepID=UPI001205F5C9|nr:hypothetical protein [Pandoraea sp.]TAM18742.1 MAG: hypothetical protein EPN65_05820 [Pandoraea sp.]
MGSLSIWHWLIVFILVLGVPLIYVPAVRKAGFSGWWVVLTWVPVVGLVLLWIFAFARWPAEPDR